MKERNAYQMHTGTEGNTRSKMKKTPTNAEIHAHLDRHILDFPNKINKCVQ